jgi:hypothetical protein
MQGVDVALALGLAETSYLICRRLGFADLGFVPFYQAILDPGAIAGKRYGKLAGRLAAPLTVAMRARGRRPSAAHQDHRSTFARLVTSARLRRAVGKPRGPATTPACGAMPATCAGDTARRRTSKLRSWNHAAAACSPALP